MRKINLKVLLAVLAGSIVVAGVVFGVHYLQRKRIASALLWQARKSEETNQIDRNILFLGRYLEFRPDDLEEKARLGKTLLSEAARSGPPGRARAVDLLDEVLRRDPDREDERRLLVKGALSIPNPARVKQAREALTILLDPLKGPRKELAGEDLGELEGYWGALFEQEGNLNEAISWCRKAVTNRPAEQMNYLRLAYLLRRLKTDTPALAEANGREANEIIDRLVERNQSSAQALLARWRYRREFDLIRVGDRKLPAATAAAAVPFDEAITDIRTALKVAPENIEVLLASADVERLQNDRKSARENLRRALDILAKQDRTNPNDYHVQQVHWQLGNLLLDNALIEKDDSAREAAILEAGPSIAVLRKARVMASAADYLDGRLQFLRGNWQEAANLLEKARTKLNEKPEMLAQINLFLGQCYEKLDESGRMYQAYQRLAGYDPNSIAAQIGMASSLWMQGKLDEAMVNYKKAMSNDKVPVGGFLDMARLELARQLQREPARRDWKGLEEILVQADKALPRSLEVSLIRVELLAGKGQYAEADALVARAIQEKPKQEAELWVLRADLARRQNKPGPAKELLDQAAKALGESVALRLARVQIALAGGGDEAVRAITEAERGLDSLTAEDQARVLEGLAAANFRLGKIAEARRLTNDLTKNPLHKNDPKLRLLLLDLALREKDDAAADQALEAIRTLEGSAGVYTRFGLAQKSLSAARRETASDKERAASLEDARRQLEMVARLRPGWSAIHTARAEMFEIQKNLEQAIVELRLATEAGDNSPGTIQRLVRALVERQRDNEADEELKKLQASVLTSREVGQLAALVAARRGDPTRALDIARSVVAVNSGDHRDLIWMARLLSAANKFDEAETNLRQATTAAPKESEPWIALVQFLVSRQRAKDAAGVLTEAEAKVEPTHKALLLALGFDALGKAADALKQIRVAEETEPNNLSVLRYAVRFYLRMGKLDLAEASLRRVLQGRVEKTTAEDRDWARRGLALTLANGTDFTRFREALELVGLPLDEKGRLPKDARDLASVELQRTQARVLATQQQQSYRSRAIELFERLDRAQSLNDEDRLMLALLQERAGAWAKARDQYALLVLKPGTSPQPLAQLILGLIRQKENGSAEQYLTKLEQMEKDRNVGAGVFGSIELRARLAEEAGQIDKAFDLLKAHVERKDATPEERLALVAFCSRNNRMEQGLKICAEARKTCRPEAVSGATVALIRSGKASDDACKEVQDWLRDVINANPGKHVLRMHLANLYDFRGKYREAEEEYREILKVGNEPNNLVAMNNLAWLLSLQTGRAEEALEIVTKAINSAGRRPELLDTRGTILLNLGRAEDALTDLKEATADAPNPMRLFHLARAFQALKDRDSATKTIRKAKEMGLQPESMHPVEQEACKKLLRDLRL